MSMYIGNFKRFLNKYDDSTKILTLSKYYREKQKKLPESR